MSIFTRYAGGTEVGNFLRSIGQKINPALGNGGAMITQQQEDLRDLPDDLYIKKYGKTKFGEIIPTVTPNQGINSPTRAFINEEKKQGLRGKAIAAVRFAKEYWYYLVFPIFLVLIYKAYKKYSKNKPSKKTGW